MAGSAPPPPPPPGAAGPRRLPGLSHGPRSAGLSHLRSGLPRARRRIPVPPRSVRLYAGLPTARRHRRHLLFLAPTAAFRPGHTAFSVRVWWQSGWLRGASHRRVGSRGRGCISSKLCCSLDSRHKMIHVKRGLGSGVGGRVGGLDDHHTWSPLRQSSQAPGRDSRAQGRGSRRPRCSRVTPAWEPHSPPLRAGRRHSPGGSQKKEVKALWVSCLGAYGRGCRHRALSPTNSDG